MGNLSAFLKSYFFLAIAALLFFACIAFIMHELFHHLDLVKSVSRHSPALHDGMPTFATILWTLSVSGFLLLSLTISTLIKNHRSQNDLAKSVVLFRNHMAAIEASRDGIAILDDHGNYTFMNEAHAKCYGYESSQEMVGKNWRIFYSPDRLKLFDKEIMPQLYLKGWWSGANTGLKKDGTEFPQEISLSLLKDGGLICLVRDVTEETKNKNLLKLIRLGVEAADDGIAICSEDNRFLFMNRSYLKIHGLDPNDRDRYIGTDWREIYNDKGREQIENVVLPTTILKGLWSGTIPVARADGTIFYGDASLTKLPDGLILGVVRDASARRAAELERQELKDQLFQAQKTEAMLRLGEGIASDFEEILHDIDNFRDLDPALSHALAKAHDLVNQLKAFSQKTGKGQASCDIWKIVEKMKAQISEKTPPVIEILTARHLDDCTLQASENHVSHIMRNICTNACEAITGGGKVTMTIREADRNFCGFAGSIGIDAPPDRMMASRIKADRRKDRFFVYTGLLQKRLNFVQVSISDTGGGISPEILENIFDPFFTTKGKERKHAAGLGLSTVHGLMIGLNGAIILETVPHEGTTVHLFFPKAVRSSREKP